MKIKILFLSFICIATLLSLFFSKEKQLRFILTLDNIESLAAGEDTSIHVLQVQIVIT